MSKNRLYWILQICGWNILLLLELLVFSVGEELNNETFVWFFGSLILCILLTHAYRLLIRWQKWATLPIYRIGIRVFVTGILLGLIVALFHVQFSAEISIFDESIFPIFLDDWLNWSKSMFTWVLSYTVYRYVENLRATEIEGIILKTSINDTEAKILRSQLNPHFVFNALNSIRALVLEDPNKAQGSITKLSNILRNSLLADRRKTVELREEIKTVQDYLDLEKVRYEDRLLVKLDIDPHTQFLQVPPMMLQTLVENGIKHGVQKAANGGFIEIISFLDKNFVHLYIRNTGQLGDKEASGGFGLKNTERRLNLLYGNDASFKIFQESDDIVKSEVIVPIQTEGIFKGDL